MAAAVKPHRDYYCYVLFRADGSPFYVGKGRKNRWLVHEKEAKRGRSYKDNIICEMIDAGQEVPKVKIAEGLDAATAAAYEIAWIAALGRHPTGPLTNLTAGGDGCVELSAESRAKIAASLTGRSNGPHSAEARAKMSAALSGNARGPHAAEHKDAIRAAMKAQWADPVIRSRRAGGGMKGRKHSPETIAKMREKALARITDAQRDRMRQIGESRRGQPSPKGMLGKKFTQEQKQRVLAGQQAYYARKREEKGLSNG